MLQSASLLPLWKQMFTSERFLHQFCQSETTIWCICIVFESLSFFEGTYTALDTTHGHTSQQCMPQLWNQQETTMQVLLRRHIDDEFRTNCSSCGGQGVTGDSLTLQQKDPSADQYWSLPMVVKCPSDQILWDIFLATETFVFHIQFLQNSIQYTTNNFSNTARVQFLAQADCFFQTLLQPSYETHPVSYPKIILGS